MLRETRFSGSSDSIGKSESVQLSAGKYFVKITGSYNDDEPEVYAFTIKTGTKSNEEKPTDDDNGGSDDSGNDDSAGSTTPDYPDVSFRDVSKSAYYYEAVKWAVAMNVTSGTSYNTFSPDASCTRAQAVTFLWKAAGQPTATRITNPFTDVSRSAYYYNAVLWAVEQGITSGTSSNTFSPQMTVTRAQCVTFLWKAAGSPLTGSSTFRDVSLKAYYVNAVKWAVANNITSGTGNNMFSPDAPCTRGQIVTLLYKDRK